MKTALKSNTANEFTQKINSKVTDAEEMARALQFLPDQAKERVAYMIEDFKIMWDAINQSKDAS